MKKANTALQLIAGLFALILLALVMFALIQYAGSRQTIAPLAQATAQLGYPPPVTGFPSTPTWPAGYPQPPATSTWSPAQFTQAVETGTALVATRAAEATSLIGTRIAELTATAATSTPLPDGRICYVDSLNQLSLLVPPGWYFDPPPSPNAVAGVTTLYNYDVSKLSDEYNFPPGGLKIHINKDTLDESQSFDQWLADLIAFYTSSTDSPPLTATDPVPYKLGSYDGVSFTLSGTGYTTMVIAVPLSDGRVLIFSLVPGDSSALSDGLSILNTVDPSGSAACISNSNGR